MQSQFETMALTESGTGYYPRRRSRSRAEGSNLLGFAFETEHRGKSHSRLGVKSAVLTFCQPLRVYVELRTSSDQPGGSGSCQ